MLLKALVSGCDERVEEVAQALREAGADVVVSVDPETLREVAGAVPPRSLHCYVQLPVVVEVAGPTVVGRVRAFLENGLLARFGSVEAVLPALRADGTLVLVTGNTSTVGGTLPDDRAARQDLLSVLAHAVRADMAPGKVRIRTMGADAAASDIAAVGLRGEPVPREDRPRPVDADLDYQDWRVEVMGLATVQV